ncbi:MATE family efflux transporter [Demequina sp.]|uniref:MATE family efflux transporter n=1 Tax=Demequina sp. TaxID=2050685 RepID=UPI003A8BAC48
MSETVPDTTATAVARPFKRIGLMRLTWPLLGVTVLTLLATLGNTVILSQADADLNAAIATANQILGVLYDVSVLFAIGALVVIAQLLGAGSEDRARRAVVMTLRATLALGLIVGMFTAAMGPVIVGWINTPADIVDDANAYLWVAAFAMVFNAFIVTATAVLRAYGRTALILVLGVVVNLLDLPLLFVCIFILDLGAVGAAIPSLLIRGVGVLLLMWFIKRQTGVGVFTKLGPRRADDGAISHWRQARLSLPTVVENGLFNVAVIVAVSFINTLGTDAINARSYALTLTALVTGVILALVQGNETLVGWDVGEHSRTAARLRTVRTALGTALAAGLLAAVLWYFAEPALAIFAPGDEVIAMAKTALLISVLLLPLSAISGVIFGALRSAGDVVVPMVLSIASTAVVMLPLSWLFVVSLDLGVPGAFWALVAGEAVKATLMTWRWLGGTWERRPSVDEDAEAAEHSRPADAPAEERDDEDLAPAHV